MGINGTIRPQKAAHGTVGISPSSISGKISVLQSPGHIHGVLPSRQQASGTVDMGVTQVHSTINVIPTSEGVPYSGAYEVTPKTYVPVVLETMRRTMRDLRSGATYEYGSECIREVFCYWALEIITKEGSRWKLESAY